MVCDAVAIMSAQVATEAFSQLKTDTKSIETLKAYIEALVGPKVEMTIYPNAITFSVGYRSLIVTLDAGGISVRGQNYSSGQVNDFSQKITAAANQLALISANNQIATLLYRKYLVESDVEVEGGARLITLTI